MNKIPEVGDIVVFEKRSTFPQSQKVKRKGVVESVNTDDEVVDLGVDGMLPFDEIIEIKGKSPSFSDS